MNITRRKLIGLAGAGLFAILTGKYISDLSSNEKKETMHSEQPYGNKTNETNATQEIKYEEPAANETSAAKKEPLYVSISGEDTRTINYENRGELERIAKRLWGVEPTDGFDAYRFLKGDIGVDVFLASDEALIEEKSENGKLYQIVSKDGVYDKSKKQKPIKEDTQFRSVTEEMYAEVIRRAHIFSLYNNGNDPLVPKCTAVKNDGEKVAIEHRIIDGKNYLAIGWNTKGLNPLDDNSYDNANDLFKGMYTSGGRIGAPTSGGRRKPDGPGGR